MKTIIGLVIAMLITALFCIYLPYEQRLKELSFKYHNNAHPNQDYTVEDSTIISTHVLAKCILSASIVYHVPADVLIGIMYAEGGHIGQVAGPNDNGSYDLGIMQINSIWIPQLAQLWHVDYLTAYKSVLESGCENIYVGTWILKKSIVRAGSIYNGIAYYHSATREIGYPYANKVVLAMKQKGLYFLP